MPKITFSHNFLWVNFRRNFTFLLGLCLSIFIFNFNSATVFAVQTPTLSVSVDNAAVNVNGNQVINSVNGTTELPLNLTINTTNKTGYTATLNTETNETALVNSGSANGAKIDSINGASSILSLPVNTWGFKTSNETNYNPIPSLATPTNIFQTTEKTNGNDVRGLNIGMKLSQNIESGSYDNKLIFSVVTNPYVGKAIMTEGPDFNNKLINLGARHRANGFRKSPTAPATHMNTINIEDEDSDYDIKMWIDPTEMMAYYYTESEKIYLNKNSSKMFDRSDDWRGYIQYISNIDLSNFDTSNVADMSSMFADMNQIKELNLSSFDTSKVTNMSSMFKGMYGFKSLDVSNFDTSNVTDMSSMFQGTWQLVSLNLLNFNTSKVKKMNSMFNGSSLPSLNLSSFNTSSVTDMNKMFYNMMKLTSLDFSNFDTTNVIDMSGMFSSTFKLTSLNLSSFNTSNVTNMKNMFAYTSRLASLDLSNFDTTNVIDMNQMFFDMQKLVSLDISNFNTNKTTNVGSMFGLRDDDAYEDVLEKIYVNNDFDTSNLMNFSNMFAYRYKLRGGNGSYLADPSTANKTWLRVDRPGVQGYFTRKS